jgi:hypothetical protein
VNAVCGLSGVAKPDYLSGTKNWVKASWLSPFFVTCFPVTTRYNANKTNNSGSLGMQGIDKRDA